MPIRYSEYPSNWLTEIRPAILERDGNKCKFCGVPNKMVIFRAIWNKIEVYQNGSGEVFRASNSELLAKDYFAAIEPLSGNENQKAIKVVLTIMHLDHDKTHNEHINLAAACQKCHLNYDLKQHMKNSKETNRKKKGLQSLF